MSVPRYIYASFLRSEALNYIEFTHEDVKV